MHLTSDQIIVNSHDFDEKDIDLFALKSFGENLSTLITLSKDQQVIALDGDWGVGKTHFLKLWVSQHNKEKKSPRAIYIDAFEMDYISDPLTGILMCLEGEKEKLSKAKTHIESLIKIAPRVVSPLARIFTKIIARGADAEIKELIEILASESAALDAHLWEEEKSRVEGIEQIRTIVSNISAQEPIVFVIDELDRCRPDFALEFLEVAKHLFASKDVHFIFGVNKIALTAMVETRYGSMKSSDRYLHKFFKTSIRLPPKKLHGKILNFFNIESSRRGVEDFLMARRCGSIVSNSVFSNAVTLRDIEQILSKCEIIEKETQVSPEAYFVYGFFTVLEVTDRNSFNNILLRSMEFDGFTRKFGPLLSDTRNSDFPDGIELLSQTVNYLLYHASGERTNTLSRHFGSANAETAHALSQHLLQTIG